MGKKIGEKRDRIHSTMQGRQEDAEEFLSCVLDGLHEEMVSQCDETEKDEIVSGDTKKKCNRLTLTIIK